MRILGSFIAYIGLFLHILTKKPSVARPFYKAALRLKSAAPSALSAYGLSLLRDFSPSEAKDVFLWIKKENPKYAGMKAIKVNLSMCYWKTGDIDEAIRLYEEIISYYQEEDYIIEDYSEEQIDGYIENNYILSEQDYMTLGYYYLVKQDYQKSEFFSKAAMKVSKGSAAALDNLGQLYYRLGDYQKAADCLTKALEINPKLADSNYYLGLTFKALDDPEHAKQCFENASNCPITGLSTITTDQIKQELEA